MNPKNSINSINPLKPLLTKESMAFNSDAGEKFFLDIIFEASYNLLQLLNETARVKQDNS